MFLVVAAVVLTIQVEYQIQLLVKLEENRFLKGEALVQTH